MGSLLFGLLACGAQRSVRYDEFTGQRVEDLQGVQLTNLDGQTTGMTVGLTLNLRKTGDQVSAKALASTSTLGVRFERLLWLVDSQRFETIGAAGSTAIPSGSVVANVVAITCELPPELVAALGEAKEIKVKAEGSGGAGEFWISGAISGEDLPRVTAFVRGDPDPSERPPSKDRRSKPGNISGPLP